MNHFFESGDARRPPTNRPRPSRREFRLLGPWAFSPPSGRGNDTFVWKIHEHTILLWYAYIYTQFFIKITYISIKHIKRMEDELDSFFFQNKLKPAALSFKFPWKDIKIWRLPKMGVSPNHQFQWIFHEININKPSNLGYPPFQETSIFINLHAENPA